MKKIKFLAFITLEVSVGTDEDGDTVYEEMEFQKDEEIEVDIVSETDGQVEVQFDDGDVTFIPKEDIEII